MLNSLYALMFRPALPRHCKIKPEEIICISIANMLRTATLDGTLKAVWNHVPNEGKRHPLVAMVMKAVGMIRGSPDYFFIWDNGGGLIEVKTPKGKLSPHQKYYQAWCQDKNVRHAVCYSAADVHATLDKWGILHG